MALTDELLAAERAGWTALTTTAGADFYRQNLTDNAVMAFEFGVLNRQQAIDALTAAPPWRSFEIIDPTAVALTEESGVLVYRVRAHRDDEPYAAVVSSIFVRSDARWRLAFHQQTAEQRP